MWLPAWYNVSDSLLKVEKVLKPPQNPITQKSFASVEIICLLSAKPTTKPNTKQAKIFTIKVPKGKLKLWHEFIHFPNI